MPAFDALLMFRTTGLLTNSSSYGPLTIHGTGLKGMAARIVFPAHATGGADDTVLAKIYASADNSTYNLIAQYEGGNVKPATAGTEIRIPFSTTKKYVKLELIVTATTPSTAFGVVKAGLVLDSNDWVRS